jgi:hypothetical protein
MNKIEDAERLREGKSRERWQIPKVCKAINITHL